MDKRQVLSWCLYDLANSSYSAVIAAVVFPVFYATHIVGNESGLGDLWWGRAISMSMLIVALSSPFMGGIADLGGLRKHFLVGYTLVCVTSVALLSSLEQGSVITGFVLIVMANVAMEGGMVFYNSFLPRIAPADRIGRVSSWGYALGYAGSITALLISLPLVNRGMFDYVWPMVSVFFLAFSIPAFIFLPGAGTKALGIGEAAGAGATFIFRTLRQMLGERSTRLFLMSFFLYQDGVNTVIVFSSIFAATTLGFQAGELIALYLLVQSTALAGAMLMAKPTDIWGPKKVIILSLCLWSSVSVGAYLVEQKEAFWAVALLAGLGLGSVQAASRALYARFIPKGHEAEYFGVYAMVGKTSAIFGPLVFGWLSVMTGSQRPAVLAVGLFFVVGLALLLPVRESRVES